MKLKDINIFIVIYKWWNRGKKLAPFRPLTLVQRQGNCLSRVNLILVLYKVTVDVVSDNILVMEGMNRGFGSRSLSVVLLGKKRTNNLGIICSSLRPVSINYSFYGLSRRPNELQQETVWHTDFSFTHRHKTEHLLFEWHVLITLILYVCIFLIGMIGQLKGQFIPTTNKW